MRPLQLGMSLKPTGIRQEGVVETSCLNILSSGVPSCLDLCCPRLVQFFGKHEWHVAKVRCWWKLGLNGQWKEHTIENEKTQVWSLLSPTDGKSSKSSHLFARLTRFLLNSDDQAFKKKKKDRYNNIKARRFQVGNYLRRRNKEKRNR